MINQSGNSLYRGTACAVINQLWAWLFTIIKNIFRYTNSQFYSWLTIAQMVYKPFPVFHWINRLFTLFRKRLQEGKA